MGAIIGFEAELSGFNKFYYQYFLPIIIVQSPQILINWTASPAGGLIKLYNCGYGQKLRPDERK